MALKKGKCKNYVNCPLADKEEIQEVDDLNFTCAHCHQPLEPIGDTPPPPPPRWIYIVIAIVVLIGLGVGGYFLFSGNKAKKAEAERAAFVADSLHQAAEQQRIADSIRLVEEQAAAEEARLQAEQEEADALRLAEEQRIADSIRVADSIRIADSIEAAQKKTVQPNQTSGNSNWNGVATYNGPMKGGQPNGIGGELVFKKNYSLDLKDGNGSTIEIKAGETIKNTKFENGKLRQGEWHGKNGARQWFSI